LWKAHRPVVISDTARMGKAAFFEPLTWMVPESFAPPLTR